MAQFFSGLIPQGDMYCSVRTRVVPEFRDRQLLKALQNEIACLRNINFSLVKDDVASEEMESLENRLVGRMLIFSHPQMSYQFCCSVVHLKAPGQVYSEGMDSDFEEFLDYISEKVHLTNYTGYTGGLATNGIFSSVFGSLLGYHGDFTYTIRDLGREVILHVGPLFKERVKGRNNLRDLQDIFESLLSKDSCVIVFNSTNDVVDANLFNGNSTLIVVKKAQGTNPVTYRFVQTNSYLLPLASLL
jgi:hypothetical protein